MVYGVLWSPGKGDKGYKGHLGTLSKSILKYKSIGKQRFFKYNWEVTNAKQQIHSQNHQEQF